MLASAATEGLFLFRSPAATLGVMRRIGVIGGMSWESTAEYLRLLNLGIRQRSGGLHSARLRVATVDFADVEAMQQAGDWAAAGDLLAREAVDLERSGAELILIATNTMHIVYDAVAAAVSVEVLHLGDVTGEAIRRAGLDRVGLLATRYTMEHDFYRGRLLEHGISTDVPGPDARAEIQRIIYDELCVGIVDPVSRERLREHANDLVRGGAQGIVLGCTELELSLGQGDVDVPVFPTTALHCDAAIDRAIGLGTHDARYDLRVDHLVLVTEQVDATLDFYRRVLGASVRDRESWHAGEVEYPALHFGTFKINVHPADTAATPRARTPVAGALDLALRWPGDVESAVAHLGRQGVEILLGPIEQEGANGHAESVYFRDLDGVLIELICYPPSRPASRSPGGTEA